MKLQEIPQDNVLARKNWVIDSSSEEGSNLIVSETDQFIATDTGLFSALVQFGDKSIHPGLVVKSFAQGGDELDLYVLTKFGWLNIQEDGFMRAAGKYSHEVFPFDYFIGNPWKSDDPPRPEPDSPHKRAFDELAAKLGVAELS